MRFCKLLSEEFSQISGKNGTADLHNLRLQGNYIGFVRRLVLIEYIRLNKYCQRTCFSIDVNSKQLINSFSNFVLSQTSCIETCTRLAFKHSSLSSILMLIFSTRVCSRDMKNLCASSLMCNRPLSENCLLSTRLSILGRDVVD